MHRSIQLAIFVALVLLLAVSAYAWPEPKKNVSAFMREKLTHSQKALEGLAIEDFALIAQGAEEMEVISQAASWQVFQTPEYVQYSLEFRRAAEDLAGAAHKKNLDGATLAYVQLTMKCVQCHKYVRGVRVTRLDGGPRYR